MKPLTECVLYTFVDSAYLHGRDPVDLAERLCLGGSDLIQFRAKDWSIEQIGEVASGIFARVKEHGVRFVINDHLAVAKAIGADFCHLGQEDFFDAGHHHVSELAGENSCPAIGLSTHSAEQATRALSAAPSYIAIGPVYATGTKPTARPVTLEYVRWAGANVRIPWFAIGGINLNNLPDVVAAGAERLCVVSAILNQRDVTGACRQFREALELIRCAKSS